MRPTWPDSVATSVLSALSSIEFWAMVVESRSAVVLRVDAKAENDTGLPPDGVRTKSVAWAIIT